jgi:hypothetical protein
MFGSCTNGAGRVREGFSYPSRIDLTRHHQSGDLLADFCHAETRLRRSNPLSASTFLAAPANTAAFDPNLLGVTQASLISTIP